MIQHATPLFVVVVVLYNIYYVSPGSDVTAYQAKQDEALDCEPEKTGWRKKRKSWNKLDVMLGRKCQN